MLTRCRPYLPVFCLLAAVLIVLVAPDFVFAQEGAEGEKPKENLVMFMIKSAGVVFGPLLLIISIILVALIVLLAMDLRGSQAIPPGFVDEFTDTVNKRKFKEAFELAKNDTSFLARVLTAGMSRLQYGVEDARDAARNMIESIRSDKDQKNNYTAVIGTLGPMLGLVGTVFGMILAFMELSQGGTPNPSKLADGISHALVVTLLGIALSVPAIFFNAFFKNRITRITMDTEHIADDLLTQMYHNSKKAGPAAPPAGPGAPPMPGAPAGAPPVRPA
ncbi:MotA/TolQ/ExbB proton channel family protein [Tuwongella immobilis]|uniref:MotA/TolQ/ExbB proton channel domain-containing protein n=1 Tax=Tuwongella immobilis TaxID=692036 RepID=A0A6C2YP01_9BACT|nr:MotA/TolQ/ExbB proton channel family protein [Tuwongella immobilis]VIP03166.1 proton channel : Biopolymer transport protein OS=Singulisphaera acidiphila (strain ATCC BAA-1392 / DSM 18658 / VKM B-2454 / MOB10) GN=Sinac_5164 PE=3 SV=1: MotA_ExbB [Tuwongella immobilis]VTS03585.1 proton channel : Biopolymer transport protein OS=Singulisphaera acidiphila (strain ATCC BAA-1392 / DSM 18658 / VKM B-2454 / MOB10) GN=Sinac_5164 PE=3 SV=1: MotA_ExbB [Tuwongella immobilis]